MQSYYGHVRTQQDAILLFEACRQGIIPRIRRRLSERERFQITSGCVYIWDEQEAGMRRWTDGKSWSASRVSGAFLTYREMDGSRRPQSPDGTKEVISISPGSSPSSRKRTKFWDNDVPVSSTPITATSDSSGNGSEEGYRYKPNGLYKQSFSITTSTSLKLHLISYYRKEDIISGKLVQPTADPRIKDTPIPVHLYPDTSPGVSLIPAITNTPLMGRPVSGSDISPDNSNTTTKGGFISIVNSPTPQYSSFTSSITTLPPSPSNIPPSMPRQTASPDMQYYSSQYQIQQPQPHPPPPQITQQQFQYPYSRPPTQPSQPQSLPQSIPQSRQSPNNDSSASSSPHPSLPIIGQFTASSPISIPSISSERSRSVEGSQFTEDRRVINILDKALII